MRDDTLRLETQYAVTTYIASHDAAITALCVADGRRNRARSEGAERLTLHHDDQASPLHDTSELAGAPARRALRFNVLSRNEIGYQALQLGTRYHFIFVAGARYGTWTKAITAPFRVELAA